MPPTILGLDVGGANLKAATADKRAVSVSFALWKQPDRLPAVLADLVGRFPDADELAVTMTGELCDCFETKREGVHAILNAVLNVSRSRPVHVWSTDGVLVDTEVARRHHLKVASANWHALATLAGQYVPHGATILVDVGSTTTDVIPLVDGHPVPRGLTDSDRLESGELVYTGARRTPVCALLGSSVAAEFFATAHDAYLLLGRVAPNPADQDTADGRPATREFAQARLSRMLGGDVETVTEDRVIRLADEVAHKQLGLVEYAITQVWNELRDRYRARRMGTPGLVLSGSGEFIAQDLARRGVHLQMAGTLGWHQVHLDEVRSLTDRLGPEVSACAPAYAVAVLATGRRQGEPGA